jgi:3-deoxy-D-manno-octulosonic-acid transferase
MYTIFYRIGIELYFLLAKISSLYNEKAKNFCEGRKETWDKLSQIQKANYNLVYWFHCASLGELEQAKPIIESIKSKDKKNCVVVSFFSPSGYNYAKNYKHIDTLIYLPKDTPANASKFIGLLKPDVAVFIKYELWHYIITEAHKHNIPLFLVSARFRNGGALNAISKNFFIRVLSKFQLIYTQDKQTYETLLSLGLSNIKESGDTRIDRVVQISKQEFENHTIRKLAKGRKIILAGSCWPKEEEVLKEFIQTNSKEYLLILAPHEIKRSEEIKQMFFKHSPILFSNTENTNEDSDVLIIDNIGMLSKLYRYCDFAFIGGGFSNSLHNIYEALVYFKPVIIGNNVSKFPEAMTFWELETLFFYENIEQLQITLNQIDSEAISKKLKKWFSENEGVCEEITETILQSSKNKAIE